MKDRQYNGQRKKHLSAEVKSSAQLQTRGRVTLILGYVFAQCWRPHCYCEIQNSNKALFLYLKLCLSVMLNCLSYSLTPLCFLLIKKTSNCKKNIVHKTKNRAILIQPRNVSWRKCSGKVCSSYFPSVSVVLSLFYIYGDKTWIRKRTGFQLRQTEHVTQTCHASVNSHGSNPL